MTWGKIDTGFHRNPKIRMAGPDAREVFLYIVLANAEQCADGVLTAHYANPAFLADALQRSEETIRNALERCETFHLLRVTATEVSIVGWDETWRTKKSTDRVRKHRERKKKQSVTTGETLRNGSNVTGNGRNGEERERKEKERAEKSREDREGGASAESSGPPSEVEFSELDFLYGSYPKKTKKAQGLALARDVVTTRQEFEKLTECVHWMKQAWKGKDTSYCPSFLAFIEGERWQDEEWPAPSEKGVSAKKGGKYVTSDDMDGLIALAEERDKTDEST